MIRIFVVLLLIFSIYGCDSGLNKGFLVSKEYFPKKYVTRTKGSPVHYPEKYIIRITDGKKIKEEEVCKEDFELCKMGDFVELNRIKIIEKIKN